MSKDFDPKIAEKALTLAVQTCGKNAWARCMLVANIYYDYLSGKTQEPKESRLQRIVNWIDEKFAKKVNDTLEG